MDWIREARIKRGWTQQQLAQRVGCHEKDISNYERGVHRPRPERMVCIAQVLGVSLPEPTGEDHE